MKPQALRALIDREARRQAQAMLASREKASGTTSTLVPPHGPNALFNTPGLGRGIVNAVIQPLAGFYGYLEARGHVHTTRYVNPVFGMLTGQTASTGTEPTANCAPGRVPGNLKICKQVWPFGQMTMNSPVISLLDAGQVNNTGESLDLQLIGNPFADLPKIVPVDVKQMFVNKQAKALVELVNAMRRDYCPLVFTGSPASTAASAGGYKEYNGLDRIINTGYVDSETQARCYAADSTIVTNLIGKNLSDPTANSTIPAEYVATLVEAYDLMSYTASQAQLGQVEFAFVGRRGLFRALTEVWPCTYRTYRCHTGDPNGKSQIVLDGNAMAQQVIDMRKGAYLLIDGVEVPFIIDDCMPETFLNNATAGGGLWTSDLYLVPLRSPAFIGDEYSPAGQITFLDFFDFKAPGAAQDIITGMQWQSHARVSNDGRYLILTEPPTRGCFEIQIWQRPRLICRAPFLAAKFEDLRYQKRFNERSPFPGNPYNLNGGNYSLLGQTFSSPVS
jgi:hypothetical protein